jgi:hypothetical protein
MLLVSVVVAVVGATEVQGSATTGVQATEVLRVIPFVHAQLGVTREFEAVTLGGAASVFLQLDTSTFTLQGQDLGSFVEAKFRVRRGWSVSAKLLPLNANVLLPTSDWAQRWGRPTLPISPALVVAVDGPELHAWVALRPSLELTKPFHWQQSVLAGFAFTPRTGFRWDARSAVLDYGANRGPLAQQPSRFALLGDVLVGYVWNEDIGPAFDFATYASDPTRFSRFFTNETARLARALRISLEGGVGAQWLPAGTALQPQPAGFADLQVRARVGWLRLFATARYRSASQVNFDLTLSPGEGVGSTPELTAILGADARIGDTGLRPGLQLRVLRSAQPKLPEGGVELGDVPSTAGPNVSVKANVVWQLGNLGAVAGEVELGTIALRWTLLAQVRF